jgi:hypothetical protein
MEMSAEQLGFDLGDTRPADKPLFDNDDMREDCLALIAEARRNGPELIWDQNELNYKRILFPHVASWITDEEERAQLCFTFRLSDCTTPPSSLRLGAFACPKSFVFLRSSRPPLSWKVPPRARPVCFAGSQEEMKAGKKMTIAAVPAGPGCGIGSTFVGSRRERRERRGPQRLSKGLRRSYAPK